MLVCAGAKPKEHALDLHLEHGEKWSVRYMSSMRFASPHSSAQTACGVCFFLRRCI